MEMEKERILVVDDERDVRDMVARIIELIGYEAIKAENGINALELLRKEPFTIMITDLKMPEMDGFELIKIVRNEFPQIYIICMTAHGTQYSYMDVVSHGATDYITKPFTIDEMKAKINRVIHEKNLVRELKAKSIALERANEELKRVDQMKSIFISRVSHELRTPLTVIKEFISLMLEGKGGTLTDEQREYLNITNKNILRLNNLIETILDFSKIESGGGLKLRLEPNSLTKIIEEVQITLSHQLEEKKIIFENLIDPDLPLLLVDRNRLIELFINLINHGIKFTPPGGRISIDSKGLTEKRDYLKIVVSDTSKGIPPDYLPKVFDRFYQGERSEQEVTMGIGIGLAVSKEIIDAHKGSIYAENRVGGGASFIFSLPLFCIENIFKLILNPMLDEAEKDNMPLSLIRVEFWDQRMKKESELNHETMESVIYTLQRVIRSVDILIPFKNRMIYILSFNDKKMAKEIGERLKTRLTQGAFLPKGIGIEIRTYCYPKDARTKEDFIRGSHIFIKEE
jgi:signal transduction histidine kinase